MKSWPLFYENVAILSFSLNYHFPGLLSRLSGGDDSARIREVSQPANGGEWKVPECGQGTYAGRKSSTLRWTNFLFFYILYSCWSCFCTKAMRRMHFRLLNKLSPNRRSPTFWNLSQVNLLSGANHLRLSEFCEVRGADHEHGGRGPDEWRLSSQTWRGSAAPGNWWEDAEN